jgi:hypothetical protein
MQMGPPRVVQTHQSEAARVAPPSVTAAFCSMRVRAISSGVSCSPRFVAPIASATRASGIAGLMPNYALERSVKGLCKRAAGARTIIAPAARWYGLARPAQRGR